MNPSDSEAPTPGQQVITACALIHQKIDGVGKVFLAKRAASKKFLPDVFELPGGHIDFGEDMVAGLKREIMEEFGMHIEVGDVVGAFTYTNKIKQSHSVEVVFFARFTDPVENIKLNPADHSEFIWIAPDEVEKVYTPSKGPNDDEFVVLRKGIDLLQGGKLTF